MRKVSAEVDRNIEGVLYPTLLEYNLYYMLKRYSVVKQDEGNSKKQAQLSKHKKTSTRKLET